MQHRKSKPSFFKGDAGFAVVEATFVFPIMFMIFFALIMLAFYLPQRAMLQRATQFTATAIATEMSDTWVYFDANSRTYRRHTSHSDLPNVYVALFRSIFTGRTATGAAGTAEQAVIGFDSAENMPIIATGDIDVEFRLRNFVVYKEVEVTATRVIPIPVNFQSIQFPGEIELVVTSTAVVVNADEFIRNVDLAVDFLAWVRREIPWVDDIFESVTNFGNRVGGLLGI